MYWFLISLGVFAISIIIFTIITILIYKYSTSNKKIEIIENICGVGVVVSLSFIIAVVFTISLNTHCFKSYLSKEYSSSQLEKKQELLFKIKEQKDVFKENAYVYYQSELDKYNSYLERDKKDNSLWTIWKKVNDEQLEKIYERIDFYKISQEEIDNL